jgi:hypothetical protein
MSLISHHRISSFRWHYHCVCIISSLSFTQNHRRLLNIYIHQRRFCNVTHTTYDVPYYRLMILPINAYGDPLHSLCNSCNMRAHGYHFYCNAANDHYTRRHTGVEAISYIPHTLHYTHTHIHYTHILAIFYMIIYWPYTCHTLYVIIYITMLHYTHIHTHTYNTHTQQPLHTQ